MEGKILRAMGDGVMVVTVQGRVRYANPTMCRYLDGRLEELEGRPFLELLDETEIIRLVGLDDLIEDSEPTLLHVVFSSLTGALRPLSSTISRLHQERDELEGYLLVCHDHTELLALLNESTRAAVEEVERRVEAQRERDEAERREQIQVASGQAQKLEAIGELAAGIAHEINTPIQFIGDNVNFLRKTFDVIWPALAQVRHCLEATPEERVQDMQTLAALISPKKLAFMEREVPRAIKETTAGVERVAHIVSAMKDIAHPSDGEMKAVDLRRLIESAVTVARNEWKYVADLTMDFDAEMRPHLCCSDEISQVLLNIVVNAAHAIAEVVGDAGDGRGLITLATKQEPDWLEIRISDTGTGMSDEVKSRVFDPFFTTKEVGKGTGQGLSLAHKVVVSRHAGTIGIDTRQGQGTTFTIRLPVDPEAQRNPSARPKVRSTRSCAPQPR